jgi:hypothetical protein
VKAALVVATLALALSGCAAAGAFSPQTGTVTGHVQIRTCGGPMPAQGQPSQPCTPRPMASVVVSFAPTSGGSAVTAVTDAAGAYSVSLKAGTYVAQVTQASAAQASASGSRGGPAYAPMMATPFEKKTVTVTAGQTVTADFIVSIQLM